MPVNPAVIQLSSLNGTNGFRIDGAESNYRTGIAVSGAGDVNGDGFADIVIGDPVANNNAGRAYVIYGKAGGFDATFALMNLNLSDGFFYSGVGANANIGTSVSEAGDINGDGFDDIILGVPGGDSFPDYSVLILGSSDGGTASTKLFNNAAYPGDQSGWSVSGAGDINGDGFDDLIIGAPFAGPGGPTRGLAHVVFGKQGDFTSPFNLSTLDGGDGFRIDGAGNEDRSGWSVSAAGDVNGDGFDDLIIGAKGADANGSSSGASYVVFGKASGFAATLSLSTLNGTNGFRIVGAAAYDNSGYSVSRAGDVNGDGFDDLIIGAIGADANGSNSGASYVVFGKGGGFASSFNLSALDGSNGFRIAGVIAFDLSGFSVSGAGDFNGDGFDDLIIGAPYADPNGELSGASYVVFGKAGGFTASLNLSTLNGTNGFRIDGVTSPDQSAWSVSGAGDVNGDGFDDLIIGAPSASTSNGQSGAGYVIFGYATGTLNRTGTDAGEHYAGGAWDDNFIMRGGDDIVDGGAGDDQIDGGEGRDTLSGGEGDDIINGGSGGDIIDGGDGDDTINAGSGDDTVHFSAGNDMISAGSGLDTLDVRAFLSGGGSVNLTTAKAAATGSTDVSTILGFEHVLGSNGKDSITGNAANNELSGYLGDDALSGLTGNDTLSGGFGKDVLNGGKGKDTLTGGRDSDRFVFIAGDSAFSNFDVITDYQKGAVNTVGDKIDFSSALVRGGSAAAATATQASINQTTGIATFKAGSGTTMTDCVNDIAARINVGGTKAGEFAFFKIANTGSYYIFISDGVNGASVNDVVVQLQDVTLIRTLNLTGGDLTILT
ncbi:MAG: hypothetical protein LCH46_05700 [Proteobacteria bacterium]|nr:hypothetical protein [Pseudomonadota bacterium]